MSKKDPAKTPQSIKSCRHITCANCIVKSYFVDLNPICPVDNCGKCVNPKDPITTTPLNILVAQPPLPVIDIPLTTSYDSSIDNLILTSNLDDIKKELEELLDDDFEQQQDALDDYYQQQAELEEQEKQDEEDEECYCGDKRCKADCGVLSCGCIDICRQYNHCYKFHRYHYD
jgi:hypothetical protein